MAKWRVLISCPIMQQGIEGYRNLFTKHDIEVETPSVVQQLSESELLKIIDHFDGVIAGDDEFTSKVLIKAKRLKVLVKWGIGVDAIDIETARKLGIRVCNTPGVFSDEVADVALGYIIMLARQLHRLDREVRQGGWTKIQGVSLQGKVLGVIGVGSIGRALVRRAVAIGMSVVGYDIASIPISFVKETGISCVKLEELLRVSDFISLNCTLTPESYHLLGTNEFALMKTGVYIVNTARGSLINEEALVQALREGKVAGAALDVFEQEPLPSNSPLREFDNCIFGTHNSSNTYEAVARTNRLAIQKLLDGLGVRSHE